MRTAWRYGVTRRVYDELFASEEAAVADIGCGLGMAVRFLPERSHYVGAEISERTLALAREIHCDTNADFRQGGFPRLPLDTASCDLALCFEVLEHVEDDQGAAVELQRILRPGGHLLVSVPGTFFWPEYKKLIGHHRHYSAGDLKALLERAGLEIARQFSPFTRVWRAYYYAYLAFRVLEASAKRLGRADYSLYESAPYRLLSRHLLAYFDRASSDNDPASTIVLARKPAEL